jgi:hypothetical protein
VPSIAGGSALETMTPQATLSKDEILRLQPPPDHAGSGDGRAAAEVGEGAR